MSIATEANSNGLGICVIEPWHRLASVLSVFIQQTARPVNSLTTIMNTPLQHMTAQQLLTAIDICEHVHERMARQGHWQQAQDLLDRAAELLAELQARTHPGTSTRH